MIPSIEQIVADLIAGTVSKEQAIAWLEEHSTSADLRDSFAMAALANASVHNSNEQAVAFRCYELADAMLARRSCFAAVDR